MISTADRKHVIQLIEEARASGARLAPACKELDISVRTYQRWITEGEYTADKRPLVKREAPKNKLSDEEKKQIITSINAPKYADLTPAQIVPKLADEGIYIASESTFCRVMKEYKQSSKRTPVRNLGKKTITTHIANGPNEVWSWDITWLPGPIKGIYFKLYLIIDIFSRFIVHWEIYEEEKASYAEQIIKKAVFKHGVFKKPLVLHSDNGSPMKAQSFQTLLDNLGITKSYSRPRVSNDNPFSESLFKTLKYTKDYPTEGFEDIKAARKWVHHFTNLYNTEFLHSGIKFVTPYQRHYGLEKEVLKNRDRVYQKAKELKTERWSKNTRNWKPIEKVALNPTDEIKTTTDQEIRQLT